MSSSSDDDSDEHIFSDDESSPFILQASFDSYFTVANKPAKTSNNVFSDQIRPPLELAEYTELLAQCDSRLKRSAVLEELAHEHEQYFAHYSAELELGFNIVFYGFGSKRNAINHFIRSQCRRRGHIIIADAFTPSFSVKDIFNAIEALPGVTKSALTANGLEGQLQRIWDFFCNSARPLFLAIHNIDSPSLRSTKARSLLAQLCSHPAIRVIASVDHVNAPLLWSQSESTMRKPSDADAYRGPTRPGFSWLWHDLTTLAPYTAELASVDALSVKPKTVKGSGVDDVTISEEAARHVLASVTSRAQQLFALLARQQLAVLEEHGQTGAGPLGPRTGMKHDALLTKAREGFIATSETSLRALLGEFTDHGLIRRAGNGGTNDVLWIPLRKDELLSLIEGLSS